VKKRKRMRAFLRRKKTRGNKNAFGLAKNAKASNAFFRVTAERGLQKEG